MKIIVYLCIETLLRDFFHATEHFPKKARAPTFSCRDTLIKKEMFAFTSRIGTPHIQIFQNKGRFTEVIYRGVAIRFSNTAVQVN